MSKINITLGSADLEFLQKGGPDLGPKLLDIVQEELGIFSSWLEKRPSPEGGPLTTFEEAILKTYLYQKLTGKF